MGSLLNNKEQKANYAGSGITRRSFLNFIGVSAGIAGFGLTGLSCVPDKHNCLLSKPKQPNIVLVMADDVGVESFGCYGGTSYKTPTIDSLANSGLKFSHCYSNPLCTPSRVKIMTGKSNVRNYKKFGILPKDERTFGNILQDCGYQTCVVGKWQLYGTPTSITGKDWWRKGTHPTDAGFDEYCLWQIDEVGSRYANPRLIQNGKYLEGMEEKYGPDVFCRYAIDFIERNQDKPFFLYHSMTLPHAPFVPTPQSPDWDKNRDLNDTKYFADMMEYIDIVVKRIVKKLDELNLREDTIVIFTGDNGTHRSIVSKVDGKAIEGGKGRMTDAGTHVPLVINWKGKTPEGKVCDDLIDFSDFLPTFADLSGCQINKEKIDGQTFLPQIYGKKGNPRESIFIYYDPITYESESNPIYFARNKRWKLYGNNELYDLRQDLLEQSPIMPEDDTRESAEIRTKLRETIAYFGL